MICEGPASCPAPISSGCLGPNIIWQARVSMAPNLPHQYPAVATPKVPHVCRLNIVSSFSSPMSCSSVHAWSPQSS